MSTGEILPNSGWASWVSIFLLLLLRKLFLMGDRLVLRQQVGSPHAPPASHNGSGAHDPEESEDEKVYYGFGVFMGLPLADLKAMKEDLILRQQGLSNGSGGGGGGTNGFGAARDTFGGAHSAPGIAPPVATANGRGQPPVATHNALYSRSRAPPPRALGREYDASRGIGDDDMDAEEGAEEDGGSDAGSDGSYSAPKSHSLNFILH